MGYITIPKALMGPTYSAISPAAKLLYGLLSDRSSLSKTNGDAWKTPSGEIFLYYPISEIFETMGCGHDKARRLLRELVDAGLIRRIRQGLGKPDKLIVTDALHASECKSSKKRKLSTQDRDSSAPNNPESINPESINPESINPDLPPLCNQKVVEAQIKDNISYDVLISDYLDQSFADLAVKAMAGAICTSKDSVTIAGVEYPKAEVYRRLMALTQMHIQYAYDQFQSAPAQIRSPRAYVLTILFHAMEDMDTHYDSKFNADKRREGRQRHGE